MTIFYADMVDTPVPQGPVNETNPAGASAAGDRGTYAATAGFAAGVIGYGLVPAFSPNQPTVMLVLTIVTSMVVAGLGVFSLRWALRRRPRGRRIKLVSGAVLLLGGCGLVSYSYGVGFSRFFQSIKVTRCLAHLRAIGLALHTYHNDFGVFPARLADLLPRGYLQPEEGHCPVTEANGISRDFDYIYISGLSERDPADWLIAFEPLANHNNGGGNFLYVDGHVELRRPLGHAKELDGFRRVVERAGRRLVESPDYWEVTPAPMSRPRDPP